MATSIDRSASDVYAYASDPANLPLWAKGLADADLERVDGRWVVDSPLGRVTIEFTPHNHFGIVDHDVTLPTGEIVNNPMRIIANETGCDVVFTVRRRASMSEADLDADCAAVAADLASLKRSMESPATT